MEFRLVKINCRKVIIFYFRWVFEITNRKIENMIHTIKKKNVSGFKSPSKVSLVHSKSTDHLTSTHKSIGRKHMLEKSTCN